METKRTIAALIVVALTVSIASSFAQDAKKPNIVFLWGDDIGMWAPTRTA